MPDWITLLMAVVLVGWWADMRRIEKMDARRHEQRARDMERKWNAVQQADDVERHRQP